MLRSVRREHAYRGARRARSHMPLLTIEAALIIGGVIIIVSIITAAVISQLWPRRVVKHIEDEQHHQRYEFADAATGPTADSEEAMRHPPPRLVLEHLTALPNRNRARA